MVALAASCAGSLFAADVKRPNIVFIMADDLGYGELGCYGQKKIQTPNIDKLCREGMKFTRHYSGAPVCAPARCALMTGKHLGNAIIRDNRAAKPLGQHPIPASETTIAELLKQEGYATGAFGKWGLGPPESSGDPLKQGFDRFFGYNCQRNAHSLFPQEIQDDDKRLRLENDPPVPGHAKLPQGADPDDPQSYEIFRGQDFAPDRINKAALEFIRANKDAPFFLYYPTVIPHLALQVPDDEILQGYEDMAWEEKPDSARYTPCFKPNSTYAALITRLDMYVGRVIDELRRQGIEDDTMIVFTSDNGATYLGPMAEFFDSTGGLRAYKGSIYEGGIRVPLIVKWPGHVKAGTESDFPCGFEDWLPTLLDVAASPGIVPEDTDGVSLVPVLEGKTPPKRQYIYREFAGYGGQQAVWLGDWKGVRRNIKKGNLDIELYNLAEDPSETKNIAEQHKMMVAEIESIMEREHTPSELFPMKALDR